MADFSRGKAAEERKTLEKLEKRKAELEIELRGIISEIESIKGREKLWTDQAELMDSYAFSASHPEEKTTGFSIERPKQEPKKTGFLGLWGGKRSKRKLKRTKRA